jgi:hypothetical protein
VSSYYYICVLILLYVSSYYCICVLILLYMCPHTTPFSPSFLSLLSLALRKTRAITSAEIIIVHRYHSILLHCLCCILLHVTYFTACYLFYCMGRRCDVFALLSGRGLVSAMTCFISVLLHGPDLLNILAAPLKKKNDAELTFQIFFRLF